MDAWFDQTGISGEPLGVGYHKNAQMTLLKTRVHISALDAFLFLLFFWYVVSQEVRAGEEGSEGGGGGGGRKDRYTRG